MFTLKEAASVTGIEHGRIREWVSRGYIVPEVPSRGRGTSALLSHHDLQDLRVFKGLIDEGHSRALAYKKTKGLVWK